MHNEQSSASTSPSARPHEVELTEADYLAREVADAKNALAHSLADLKAGLANSADLRQWTKHYPWAALGAAAAAGFAAAAAVTPAPGESLQDKLSKPHPDGHSPSKEADGKTTPRTAKSSFLSDKLVASLFDLAKVLIQTLLVASVRNPPATDTPHAASSEPWETSVANQRPNAAAESSR